MKFDINKLQWTREPAAYTITDDTIEIVTSPHTDLWQRTYYHFRNDNAPVLQMETDEKFFSFTVKTQLQSKQRFDQCGFVMYLDSENWLKGSVEYENKSFQHLGSVVTNHGYSDWATTEIDAGIKTMWYRFSRRNDDYCIACSEDGVVFKQMRICHMYNGNGKSVSVFMPAALKIHHSRQFLQTWKSQNANGWPRRTTARFRIIIFLR